MAIFLVISGSRMECLVSGVVLSVEVVVVLCWNCLWCCYAWNRKSSRKEKFVCIRKTCNNFLEKLLNYDVYKWFSLVICDYCGKLLGTVYLSVFPRNFVVYRWYLHKSCRCLQNGVCGKCLMWSVICTRKHLRYKDNEIWESFEAVFTLTRHLWQNLIKHAWFQ